METLAWILIGAACLLFIAAVGLFIVAMCSEKAGPRELLHGRGFELPQRQYQ